MLNSRLFKLASAGRVSEADEIMKFQDSADGMRTHRNAKGRVAVRAGEDALQSESMVDDAKAVARINEALQSLPDKNIANELVRVLALLEKNLETQNTRASSPRETTLGVPGVETPQSAPRPR